MDLYKQLVDKTKKVGVGYKHNDQEHKEGDKWEEDGKQWQIKNGIKCSIPKLSSVRQGLFLPEVCPVCGKKVENTIQNKKAFKYRAKCFDCMIDEDNERMVNGTYKEFEKEEIKKSVDAYVEDVEQYLVEYLQTSDSKQFVSENGEIEGWSHDKEAMKKKIKEYFEKLKLESNKIIEDYDDISKLAK